MKRGDPDALVVDGCAALPAPARVVIDALTACVTPARRARIDAVVRARTYSVALVLERISDPHNASAVLRTADAMGVQRVHVIEDGTRFTVARAVARGTHQWLDIVRHQSAETCVGALHRGGYEVLVAAMDGELAPEDLRARPRVALVYGNEHRGVSPELRGLVDGSFRVSMHGFVESLNVSVAAAVALYVATRGRQGDLGDDEQDTLRARLLMATVRDAERVLAKHTWHP